jgi:hypothetical protein
MSTPSEYAGGHAEVQPELANYSNMIINLPAARVMDDSALIEQVIGQIFDRLGQAVVELRVLAEP